MKLLLLLLVSSILGQGQGTHLKVGETLHYDVTFGGILKGNTVISFYGKVTSFTRFDTSYIKTPIDSLRVASADSTSDKEVTLDSVPNPNQDSTKGEISDSISGITPESLMVVIAETTNIYYITYNTKFIGNIYNLHADIYARDDFTPLLIETKIRKTGKLSKGRELFYPDRNMAIFSQFIENKEEIDTIQRKNPLQDITTLPFYFKGINFNVGDSFNISLPQGEYKLTCVKNEKIEIGEGYDFASYNTYLVESEPKGYKVWLSKKDKIPVKVNIEGQKIKMVLKKKEIEKSIKQNRVGKQLEEKIRAKLNHLFQEDTK